jgi:hypothetical protein
MRTHLRSGRAGLRSEYSRQIHAEDTRHAQRRKTTPSAESDGAIAIALQATIKAAMIMTLSSTRIRPLPISNCC